MLSLAWFMVFLALAMFLPAGRLGWTRGWVFFATYLVMRVATTFYLWRTNPEVVVARSTVHRGNSRRDKVLFALLADLFVAMFLVAAVDDGRFHWSSVPLWLTAAGYVLFLIGMAGNACVLGVNKFAEPGARIQAERGQKVVQTGPYAIVRHPLYATAFCLNGGIPLALGSFWALIPAAVAAGVLVMRTASEDRMLHNGLAGYKEYAGRVRYRLLPGVW
jgi:protein-S-isoprenylcysteine O-methyltransferase Ste14